MRTKYICLRDVMSVTTVSYTIDVSCAPLLSGVGILLGVREIRISGRWQRHTVTIPMRGDAARGRRRADGCIEDGKAHAIWHRVTSRLRDYGDLQI